MRHDAERPQTLEFGADAPVPGQWIGVLATMRGGALTRLSVAELREHAPHILIVAPEPAVARASFADLLAAGRTSGERAGTTEGASDATGTTSETAQAEWITVVAPDALTAEAITDVPAGTWVFLPHRQDGWTELEATSSTLRRSLVGENTVRERGSKLTLIEYGVNLWLWAEPPYEGGDPVCHAGELISWESAWALQVPARENPESARPPIYFGLPEVLRQRRSHR